MTTTTIDAIGQAATDLCHQGTWTGIPDRSFEHMAETGGYPPGALEAAVMARCPNLVYSPLSEGEITWCGDGYELSRNYFNVVEAGIELELPSFSMVSAGLIAKTKARKELTEYEFDLLYLELESMSKAPGFQWDWAQACRATF
jgi:hypothetical protein